MQLLNQVRNNTSDSDKETRSLFEYSLGDYYDMLMKEYGYISKQEFIKIPLRSFWIMISKIQARNKKMKEEHDKIKEKTKKR